jgi:predicted CopG family antitoxin
MSYKTISLSIPVYERLKKLKQPGESFSDVLWRELPQPLDTFGEIDAHFEKHGVPKADPKLRKAVLEGRGRRSKR